MHILVKWISRKVEERLSDAWKPSLEIQEWDLIMPVIIPYIHLRCTIYMHCCYVLHVSLNCCIPVHITAALAQRLTLLISVGDEFKAVCSVRPARYACTDNGSTGERESRARTIRSCVAKGSAADFMSTIL